MCTSDSGPEAIPCAPTAAPRRSSPRSGRLSRRTSPHTPPTAATTAERICAEPPRSPPQLRRGPHDDRRVLAGRTVHPVARPIRYRRNNHPPTRRLNMTTHIDTLKEWWSEAEEGVIEKGDTVINWFGGETTVYVAAERARRQNPHTRILARAPTPKPAWHDAVAVIEHTDDGHIRQAWERDGDTDYWGGTEGYLVRTEKLRDVTPLIEARVTDETLARVEAAFTDDHDSFDARIRAVTAAALGLDPEPAGRSTGPHLHYDAKENA